MCSLLLRPKGRRLQHAFIDEGPNNDMDVRRSQLVHLALVLASFYYLPGVGVHVSVAAGDRTLQKLSWQSWTVVRNRASSALVCRHSSTSLRLQLVLVLTIFCSSSVTHRICTNLAFILVCYTSPVVQPRQVGHGHCICVQKLCWEAMPQH